MKKLLTLTFYFFILNSYADDEFKIEQIKKITEGTYDLIEWRDGDKVFVPPEATARFIMADGFLMFTAFKADGKNKVGFANWGEYEFTNGTFSYGYSETLTISTDNEEISVSKVAPYWTVDMILPNMRNFKITHDKDRVKFTYKKALFDFNKNGLIYTDYNTGSVRKYVRAQKNKK